VSDPERLPRSESTARQTGREYSRKQQHNYALRWRAFATIGIRFRRKQKNGRLAAAMGEIPHPYLAVRASTFGTLRLFRAEFFGGELLGGGEGIGGGNFYVGFDAGSFPVGLGDGVDGPGKRHANHEMAVNAVT
jgi:hypothetical protein